MSNPGDISARIIGRFTEVQASTYGKRSDLRITDAVEVEAGRTYRLVLSYNAGQQPPTLKDMAQHIKHATNDTVEVKLATARLHDQGRQPGLSVMVEARRLTRPLADAKDETRMIPVVANAVFMDVELGENWSVAVDPTNGSKHLECVRSEDVGAMLKSAVTANTRVHAGLKLDNETVAGACCPEKGDVVQFYADNALRNGTVMSIKGQDVRVAEADGNSFIVPLVSIVDIVQKNEASAQEALNEQASFYATFYGQEFARQMFPNAKI